MELYDLEDSSLDDEELLESIFNYLLELEESENVTDASINEITTKSVKDKWDTKKRNVTINTYDDAKKENYGKLYFGGESDSNQSKYELLSNRLNICVSAKSEIVGKCLHTFLRQIIDEHKSHWFLWRLDGMGVNKGAGATSSKKTVPEIVDRLSIYFNAYGKCHDIRTDGIYVKTKLRGYTSEQHISRFIGDIDVWDIYRIGCVLGIWFEGERYKNVKGCL